MGASPAPDRAGADAAHSQEWADYLALGTGRVWREWRGVVGGLGGVLPAADEDHANVEENNRGSAFTWLKAHL